MDLSFSGRNNNVWGYKLHPNDEMTVSARSMSHQQVQQTLHEDMVALYKIRSLVHSRKLSFSIFMSRRHFFHYKPKDMKLGDGWLLSPKVVYLSKFAYYCSVDPVRAKIFSMFVQTNRKYTSEFFYGECFVFN